MIRQAHGMFPNPFLRTSPARRRRHPRRYDSSRLPGKVLADIAGRPMVEHVYRRAAKLAVSTRSSSPPMTSAFLVPWNRLAASSSDAAGAPHRHGSRR